MDPSDPRDGGLPWFRAPALVLSAPRDLALGAARDALAHVARVVVLGQDAATGEVRAVRRGLLPWTRDEVVVRVGEGTRVTVEVLARPAGPWAVPERAVRTAEQVRSTIEGEVLRRFRDEAARER